MVLSGLVFVEIELNEVALLHGFTSHWISPMFPQVRHDIEEVENDAIDRAVRVAKRRHTDMAVVKGKLDKLLLRFKAVNISVPSTPIRLHLLVGDPHLVLVVPTLAHFFLSFSFIL